MKLLPAVRFFAIFASGLVAGILFGDRMGATFARPTLTPSAFVQFQQVLHVRFVPLMPILIAVAILASMTWLILLRHSLKTTRFALVASATIGMILVFALTRTVNVPINRLLMTWSVSAPPPNVMELWRPWEQAHTVRTITSVLAFALQLWALNLSSREHSLESS